MYAICEKLKEESKKAAGIGKLITLFRVKSPATKENGEDSNNDDDSTSGTDELSPFGGFGMFGGPVKPKPSADSIGDQSNSEGANPFQPPWGSFKSEGGGAEEEPKIVHREGSDGGGFGTSMFGRGSTGELSETMPADDAIPGTVDQVVIGIKKASTKEITGDSSGFSTEQMKAIHVSWKQSTADDNTDALSENYTAWHTERESNVDRSAVDQTAYTMDEGTTGEFYTTGDAYITGDSYGTGEMYITGESYGSGKLYKAVATNKGTSISMSDATISSLWSNVNETVVSPSFTEGVSSNTWYREEATGTFGDVIQSNISAFLNVSVTASRLLTTTTQQSNFSDDDDYRTKRPISDLSDLGLFEDIEPNITAFISKFYNSYEFISEGYIMTAFAALGLIANGLAIVALSRDRRIWPMTRGLHGLFFVSEQLFLAMAIAFLQIRSQASFIGWAPDSTQRLEIANYFTAFFGLTQTLSTWLLYVLATESYRTVRQLVDPEKGSEMSNLGGPRNAAVIVLLALGFFSAYLPPVRVPIYEYFKGDKPSAGVHQLCNVPLENHWDFALREVPEQDLFYILYYSLGYILLDYVLPFIFICCRDKDIIDILHRAQKHKELIANYAHVLCPALAVSVMCNVYLVCIALKMVILTFKIFEFANGFVAGATVFFRYLNVYSNFLQILKSSLHLGIVVMYNDRLRGILWRACKKQNKKKSRGGRRRSAAAGGGNRVAMNKSHTITTTV